MTFDFMDCYIKRRLRHLPKHFKRRQNLCLAAVHIYIKDGLVFEEHHCISVMGLNEWMEIGWEYNQNRGPENLSGMPGWMARASIHH
jgi:hypothetical protein